MKHKIKTFLPKNEIINATTWLGYHKAQREFIDSLGLREGNLVKIFRQLTDMERQKFSLYASSPFDDCHIDHPLTIQYIGFTGIWLGEMDDSFRCFVPYYVIEPINF